jgi:phage-related minor tail protein
MDHLFDYGFAGAAILILAGLAYSWQKAYVQTSRETNKVIMALTEVIGKCRGPGVKHG